MTKADFFYHINALITGHPMIAKSKRKTVNELLYVLRMDKEHDYCVSINDPTKKNQWSCIPSVKECFVPVRDLKMHVKSIDYYEDDQDCPEICFAIVVEK